MPKLSELVSKTVSGFDYSAARPEKLQESEYTLATIAIDVSGSVSGFETQLSDCARQAVLACAQHVRGANVLMRVITFNSSIQELVGFTPLLSLDPAALQLPSASGGTSLFDAIISSASASNDYAKTLWDHDFNVNAVMFVITDGDDTSSRQTLAEAKRQLQAGVAAEYLASFECALIGVNCAQYLSKLQDVAKNLGLAGGLIDAGNATPAALAKLARFISRSISQTSQSLIGSTPVASSALLVTP